ncbi:CT214 family putative inclusion membrane protein [Chlamydiifrater phoenicopteri]|uniref:CT214 family putative inclusion membrane protein n=1 Tax=Chlamydiifrater phoenicopteri TaxID=2681469 RepID=UPI001BD0DFE4|nr:hypothetical protein [Chlamydiifrater phoenicopteri]
MNSLSNIINSSNDPNRNNQKNYENKKTNDYTLKINDLKTSQARERILAVTSVVVAVIAIITLLALQFALPGVGLAILAPAIVLALSATTSVILAARLLLKADNIEKNKNRLIESVIQKSGGRRTSFSQKLSPSPDSSSSSRTPREKISKKLDEIEEILALLEESESNAPIKTSSQKDGQKNSPIFTHQPFSRSNILKKATEKISYKTPKDGEAWKEIDDRGEKEPKASPFLASKRLSHYQNRLGFDKTPKKQAIEQGIKETKKSLSVISKNLIQLNEKICSGKELLTPYQASYLYSGLGSSSEISELLKNINYLLEKNNGGELFFLTLSESLSLKEASEHLEPLFILKNIFLKGKTSPEDKKAALTDLLTLVNLFLSGWSFPKNSELNKVTIEKLSQKLKLSEKDCIEKYFTNGNFLEMISQLCPGGEELLEELLKYDISLPPLSFGECSANLRKNKKFSKQIGLSFSEKTQDQLLQQTKQFFSQIEQKLPRNSLGLLAFANNLPTILLDFEKFFSRFHPDFSSLLIAVLENKQLKEKIHVILPRSSERMLEKIISILSLGVLRCGFMHRGALKLLSSSLKINEQELEEIILNKETGKTILK